MILFYKFNYIRVNIYITYNFILFDQEYISNKDEEEVKYQTNQITFYHHFISSCNPIQFFLILAYEIVSRVIRGNKKSIVLHSYTENS